MGHQGSLIGKIALWVIAALGSIFTIMIYTGDGTNYQENLGISGGIMLTYIAFGLCTVMAIGFAVIGLVNEGKKALPTLLGLAGFLVLLGISYAIADGSVEPEWGISESTSKWIGAGLTMTGIAAVTAVVAIVFGEINRMLK